MKRLSYILAAIGTALFVYASIFRFVFQEDKERGLHPNFGIDKTTIFDTVASTIPIEFSLSIRDWG